LSFSMSPTLAGLSMFFLKKATGSSEIVLITPSSQKSMNSNRSAIFLRIIVYNKPALDRSATVQLSGSKSSLVLSTMGFPPFCTVSA
jgi:hypothetical protein